MPPSTSGLTLLGRVLKQLADAPPTTVASLAEAVDFPRSSVFECVRAMEQEGLVERDGSHYLLPGTEAARLGFAACGIGRLQRAAAPLMVILRNDTNASVDLLLRSGLSDELLVRRRATWDMGEPEAGARLHDRESQLHCLPDGRSVLLRLRIHPAAGKADLQSASQCLAKVADALRRELRNDGG